MMKTNEQVEEFVKTVGGMELEDLGDEAAVRMYLITILMESLEPKATAEKIAEMTDELCTIFFELGKKVGAGEAEAEAE